jgi:hypothetical protein
MVDVWMTMLFSESVTVIADTRGGGLSLSFTVSG